MADNKSSWWKVGAAGLGLVDSYYKRKGAQEGAEVADPFGSQRPAYQELLSGIYSGTPQGEEYLSNLPSVRAGTKAAIRRAGATGHRYSGNLLAELQEVGQSHAGTALDRLAILSGAHIGAPGTAGKITAGAPSPVEGVGGLLQTLGTGSNLLSTAGGIGRAIEYATGVGAVGGTIGAGGTSMLGAAAGDAYLPGALAGSAGTSAATTTTAGAGSWLATTANILAPYAGYKLASPMIKDKAGDIGRSFAGGLAPSESFQTMLSSVSQDRERANTDISSVLASNPSILPGVSENEILSKLEGMDDATVALIVERLSMIATGMSGQQWPGVEQWSPEDLVTNSTNYLNKTLGRGA